MHELSIAHSLVELASAAALEARARSVKEVHIAVGALSGVAAGALQFCYEIAILDTPLAGSRLVIREVPAVLHCAVCDSDEALLDLQRFRCPRCGTPSADLRQGRELDIESLEVEVE